MKRDPTETLYEMWRLSSRVSRGFGWFLIVVGVFVPLANRCSPIQKPHLAEIIARESAHWDPMLLAGVMMGILVLVLTRQADTLREHVSGHGAGVRDARELRRRARFGRIGGWVLLACGIFIPIGSRLVANLRPEMAEVVGSVNAWTDLAALYGVATSLMFLNLSRALGRCANAAEQQLL